MGKIENFYFDGNLDSQDNLLELFRRKYNHIEISNVVFEEHCHFIGIDGGKVDIKNCIFRSGLDISNSKIERLLIDKCRVDESLNLASTLVVEAIQFINLEIEDTLYLNKLPDLSLFNIVANRLVINDQRVQGAIVIVSLEDCKFDSVKIFSKNRSSKWHISGNVIDEINYIGGLETCFTFVKGQSFKKVYLSDIERLDLEGMYNVSIDDLTLNNCGILYLSSYRESADEDYIKEEEIASLSLFNCVLIGNHEFVITNPMSIDLRGCKFDTYLIFRFVYNRNHITPSKLSILDKNSGDILIEHGNLNLKFTDVNFSSITVKESIINTLTFDNFSNHGKINFINSKSVSQKLNKDKKGINDLIANNSTLDNINFHFFDLRAFRYIQFINTNILGIQLVHYPNRLVNYSENLEIQPCLHDKEDFNQNAKFAYNQLRLLAERNGNIDKSIMYRSLEQNYLRKTKEKSFDKMLLLLNGGSNRHGSSWVRGVCFTLIAGFTSFIVYQYSMGASIFTDWDFYANFIHYIATYPKLQLKGYEAQTSIITELARLFGTIFIGYGIYQTISAFRKYGKR